MDPPSPSITKKTEAIYAVTKKVCHLHAKRQIKNAFVIHNSLDTKIILDLPLQSNIHMWRKKKRLKGTIQTDCNQQKNLYN